MQRRDFIKNSSFGLMGAGSGIKMMQAESNFTFSMVTEDGTLPSYKSKELLLLNNKPIIAETPLHLLDDAVTPIDKMFVRNNGNLPETININTWQLTVAGESAKQEKTYRLQDLKSKFTNYSYQMVLECGGNGRAGFVPQTSGNQWDQGGVSCAKWTGIRLKDLLNDIGIKADAVYIGYYSLDTHLSNDPAKQAISRGIPIAKALENETLLAWAVNDKELPLLHGYPLRLVVGGFPASVSGKWLSKIVVRNKVHDGAKMEGHNYKIPKIPIQPGEKLAETDENFKIIEQMPVKSIITYPKIGAMIMPDKPLKIRGKAWSGFGEVKEVSYSIDHGQTWQLAKVDKPANKWAWQQWVAEVALPSKGYFEIWAKATDVSGKSQPMVVPAWNPGGYLNNACHRIAVKVI